MTTKQTITFQAPLPPSGLRANRRARDHGYRARLTREYAEQVWCACFENGQVTTSNPNSFGLHGNLSWARVRVVESPDGKPKPPFPWKRAKVHYEWHSTHQTDEDNIIASMKAALDVIKATGPRPLGILQDDAGAVISATWVKVSHRKDECVVVEITRLEETMSEQDAR